MLRIEAQSTPVIALLVLGVCYMLTAAIFCLAAIFSRRTVAQDLKAVVPVLTPLGIILGLLIGFQAARVWTNLDRAGEYVGQEAGALRETVLLADSLPPEVRASVRQAIRRHLHLVETEEWPAMARGRATLQSIAVGLAEALTAVLSFTPVQANQQAAQEHSVAAIERALDARRNRVRLSQAEIAPIQWIVIIVLAVLILITLAVVLIEQRLAMAITMFIYSTAIAVCLVLLMVYDRPFGVGGFVIQPTVLRDIMPD
jgi:energy-coupling factor transporter transmembrane protein EcfT